MKPDILAYLNLINRLNIAEAKIDAAKEEIAAIRKEVKRRIENG